MLVDGVCVWVLMPACQTPSEFRRRPNLPPPKDRTTSCLLEPLHTRTDANGLEENGQVARDVADGGKDVTHGAVVRPVCVAWAKGAKISGREYERRKGERLERYTLGLRA